MHKDGLHAEGARDRARVLPARAPEAREHVRGRVIALRGWEMCGERSVISQAISMQQVERTSYKIQQVDNKLQDTVQQDTAS